MTVQPVLCRTRASTAQSPTLEVDTTTKCANHLQMVAIAGWVAPTVDTAHVTTNRRTTRGSKIGTKTTKEGTLGTFMKASTRIPHQGQARIDSARTAHLAAVQAPVQKTCTCPSLGQWTQLPIVPIMREAMLRCSCNKSHSRNSSSNSSRWIVKTDASRWGTGQNMSAHLGRSTTTTAGLRCLSGRSLRSGLIGKNNSLAGAAIAVEPTSHWHPPHQATQVGVDQSRAHSNEHPLRSLPQHPQQHRALPQLLSLLPAAAAATTSRTRSIPLAAAAAVVVAAAAAVVVAVPTLWCQARLELTSSQRQGNRTTHEGVCSSATWILGKMRRHRTWTFLHQWEVGTHQTAHRKQPAPQHLLCFCHSRQ